MGIFNREKKEDKVEEVPTPEVEVADEVKEEVPAPEEVSAPEEEATEEVEAPEEVEVPEEVEAVEPTVEPVLTDPDSNDKVAGTPSFL